MLTPLQFQEGERIEKNIFKCECHKDLFCGTFVTPTSPKEKKWSVIQDGPAKFFPAKMIPTTLTSFFAADSTETGNCKVQDSCWARHPNASYPATPTQPTA